LQDRRRSSIYCSPEFPAKGGETISLLHYEFFGLILPCYLSGPECQHQRNQLRYFNIPNKPLLWWVSNGSELAQRFLPFLLPTDGSPCTHSSDRSPLTIAVGDRQRADLAFGGGGALQSALQPFASIQYSVMLIRGNGVALRTQKGRVEMAWVRDQLCANFWTFVLRGWIVWYKM